jgi:hypothetical protein
MPEVEEMEYDLRQAGLRRESGQYEVPSTTPESVYNVGVLSTELILEKDPHELMYTAR